LLQLVRLVELLLHQRSSVALPQLIYQLLEQVILVPLLSVLDGVEMLPGQEVVLLLLPLLGLLQVVL